MPRPRFWISSLFCAVLTIVCHQTLAQNRTANVTRLKLENYGWQPLPKIQREWIGFDSQLISIDRNGRVLVGFTARENSELATREHPGLSFHILRFGSEGKVDLSLVLPTKDYFTNGLYLGPNDQIFARANETLQVLSEEDGAGNKGAAWGSVATCSRNCQISQSPSRRTLIVTTFEGNDRYSHILLDASSSPPRVVQNCPRTGGVITDKFAYGLRSIGTQVFARRWPLCDPEHSVELPVDVQGGSLQALDDTSFLLLGIGKRRGRERVTPLRGIELVTADGQVKFRHEMPKNEVVTEELKSDEHGDRFALIIETWKGGSRVLDISGNRVARRMVVYSNAGQQLSTVPVNPVYHRDFGFSMSPDGHRLAILDENEVTIVDLE
jgi:hypothetical protein